jgi:hypothetical protein
MKSPIRQHRWLSGKFEARIIPEQELSARPSVEQSGHDTLSGRMIYISADGEKRVYGLLWGVLFSSIGFGFFLYGKKQRSISPLVCGVALMIFPYFVANTWLLVLVGVILTALPYFVRL